MRLDKNAKNGLKNQIFVLMHYNFIESEEQMSINLFKYEFSPFTCKLNDTAKQSQGLT